MVRKITLEYLYTNFIYKENASPDIIEQLANTDSWQVKICVACHNNTPTNTLDKLSKESNDIRQVVAKNPCISSTTLEKLLQDIDERMRAVAKANLNL